VRQQRKRLERHDTGGTDELVDSGRRGALSDHLFGGEGVAVVHAEDVDGEHARHVFFGEVEERLYLGDAGVGDHGGEGTEFGDGAGDHGLDFGAVRDVGDGANGFAADGFDLGYDLLGLGQLSRDEIGHVA